MGSKRSEGRDTHMYQGTKPFSVALLMDSVQMELV